MNSFYKMKSISESTSKKIFVQVGSVFFTWQHITGTGMQNNRDNNFDLQQNLSLQSVEASASSNTNDFNSTDLTSEPSFEWISAFNTSLLTTRAAQLKDRSQDLTELMQSSEFKCLVIGAKHLAEIEGLSKEQATERMIEVFRRIDFAWKQIVMKRGMQAMIE